MESSHQEDKIMGIEEKRSRGMLISKKKMRTQSVNSNAIGVRGKGLGCMSDHQKTWTMNPRERRFSKQPLNWILKEVKIA